MRKGKWYFAGLVYFSALFAVLPSMASAYIDPSITSYAIQAIAGIVIASGAFFAAYGRRAKKGWLRALGMEENEIRKREAEAEVYDEDLREELEKRKEAAERLKKTAGPEPKHGLRRILLSLLCGFSLAMTLILRPVISFYLSNEGEFWFSLESVIGFILLIFFALAVLTALVHYFLPDRRRLSFRLLFAALVAAVAVCVFIQNHFMSSYLPVLTGDPIDWSLYRTQNLVSIALWVGVVLLFVSLALIRPRFAKAGVYLVMVFLLCTETIAGTADLLSAKHENQKNKAYFSEKGIQESSEAGNVVVLISDTFEATYMNKILEESPEYRDLLSDCTYYDNVTGVSVVTYYSYAKLLTGTDFPMGAKSEQGITYCFENQTTVDRVLKNGWDVEYFTTFSPTTEMVEKVLNCSDDHLEPDPHVAWALSKYLVKSTLFQSLPQPLKPHFLVYTSEYDWYKTLVRGEPYVVDDLAFISKITDGLTAVEDKPRYSIVQLWGVHNPCYLDENCNYVEYGEDVPGDVQRDQAARAHLKLLRAYLDKLKEAGTYDQTTVIMMADHGFNQRFYPVFIVKEANRSEEGFRVDSAPVSLQLDYENLISDVTSGLKFSETVSKYADANRTRTALDFYCSTGYGGITDRRSVVEITGDAKDPESYTIAADEFLLDNEYPGRCLINTPFMSEGRDDHTVAVYGLENSESFGHSVFFDAFFTSEENESVVLKAAVCNITDLPQKLVFKMDGEIIATETLPVSDDPQEVIIPLPGRPDQRCTVEINLPDAVLAYNDGLVLEWTRYNSIRIKEAGFYNE